MSPAQSNYSRALQNEKLLPQRELNARLKELKAIQSVAKEIRRAESFGDQNDKSARNSLAKFKKDHPRSPYVTIADAMQSELDQRAQWQRKSPKPIVLTPKPVNSRAPNFDSKDLSGNPVRLKDLRGKVVVVNFWGLGSPECDDEAPHLEAIYRKHRSKGLIVLGVTRDDAETAKADAAGKRSYPVIAEASEIFDSFGVTPIPSTFVIDRKGVIRYRHTSFQQGQEGKLEQEVIQLLSK